MHKSFPFKMSVEQISEIYGWADVQQQYYATIAANLIVINQGCLIGWMSPAMPILKSNATPLASGQLSNEQVSWIGSINWIAALFGSICFGYFTAQLGSKKALLFLAAPLVAYWLLIYFGTTYYYILIARFISGLTAGGVHATVILFVSEIVDDDIRGRLGSFAPFFRNIGTLIGYILGTNVKYEYVPLINLIVPAIFCILFLLLPNTPRYYLHKGKIQKAEKALKHYKGYKEKNRRGEKTIYDELERLKMITNERKQEEQLKISDFLNRNAIKGLGIGIALTTFVQLTANYAIVNYAVITFAKAKTNFSAHTSSIILAVSLTVGSVTTTYLADKFGRKALNFVSLLGSAIGLMVVSGYHYSNLNGYDVSSFTWIPTAFLSFVIFISSAGIIPLSLVCSVENLPPKIRTAGMTIVCFSFSLVTFVSVKCYPILLEILDLHGCLMIYAIGSFIGAIFVLFVLDETTGSSLDKVGMDENTSPIDDRNMEKLNNYEMINYEK